MTMDRAICVKQEVEEDFGCGQPMVTSICDDLYEDIEFENFKIDKLEPEADDTIQFESDTIVIAEEPLSKTSEIHKFANSNRLMNVYAKPKDSPPQFLFDSHVVWQLHDSTQIHTYKSVTEHHRQSAKIIESVRFKQVVISAIKLIDYFCGHCNRSIEVNGPFRLNSHVANSTVKFLCESCHEKNTLAIARKSEGKQLIILIRKLSCFSCIQCSRSIDRDGPFHVKINSKGSSFKFVCLNCVTNSISPVSLHNQLMVPKCSKIICWECHKVFANITNLRIHNETEHPKNKITRPHEDKRDDVDTSQAIDNGLQRNALQLKTIRKRNFKCTKCPTTNLLRHMNEVHNKQRFFCGACKKPFSRKYNLNKHMEVCRNIIELNDNHLKSEHANIKHVETVKTILKKIHLKASHKKLNRNKIFVSRRYKCDQCPRRFTTHGNRYRHIDEVHSKETKFFCEVCRKSFIKKYNFDVHMINAHKNLEMIDNHVKSEYANFKQIETVKVEYEKVHFEASLKKANRRKMFVSRRYKCDQCPRRFGTSLKRYRHINEVHSKQTMFFCEVCRKSFIKKYNYELHMINAHKNLGMIDNHVKSENANIKHLDTAKTVRNNIHFKTFHKKLTRNKIFVSRRYKCDQCPRKFTTHGHQYRHIDEVHNKLRKFFCELCEKTFIRKYDLDIHFKKTHTDVEKIKKEVIEDAQVTVTHVKVECNKTNRTNIKTGRNKIKQMNVLANLRLDCDLCPRKLFSSIGSLKRHKNEVHRQLKFSCEVCKKAFKRQYEFNTHMKIVHSNVVWLPEQSKTTNEIEPPVAHKIVKTTENAKVINRFPLPTFKNIPKIEADDVIKNFSCGECEKTFVYKHNLKRHYRTAHRNTPQFKNVEAVKGNISVNKNFACSECKITFLFLHSLKYHFRSVHGNKTMLLNFRGKAILDAKKNFSRDNSKPKTNDVIKNFSCGDCEKTFVYKHSLKQHCRTIHNNEERPNGCNRQGKRLNSHKYGPQNVSKPIGNDIKMFPCGECNKSYALKNSARKHFNTVHRNRENVKSEQRTLKRINKKAKASHENEKWNISKMRPANGVKPFSCGECMSSYVLKGSLKRHFDTCHKNKIMHMCEKCHKAFRTKALLQMHIDIFHKRNHKNRCADCKRVFSSEYHLKAHIDAYHRKIKKFKCLKCNRKYSSQKILNVHITKNHK